MKKYSVFRFLAARSYSASKHPGSSQCRARESRGRGRDLAENCARVRQNYGIATHWGGQALTSSETVSQALQWRGETAPTGRLRIK